MVKITCDNQTCNKETAPNAIFYELKIQSPNYATAGNRSEQFCSLGCVSEHAARACGKEVK